MKIFSLLIIILFVFPLASFGDIYSYVDQIGVYHFTNVPVSPKYKFKFKEKIESKKFLNKNYLKYDDIISYTANKYGVDSALIKAIIRAESNFNHRAISPKGAQGLMQLMPDTAYKMDVIDPFNPVDNIEGGVRYIRYLLDLFNGDLSLALAAYNAGIKEVRRFNGIPPFRETREYIRKVLKFFRLYKNNNTL